jgi:hypothetical protein
MRETAGQRNHSLLHLVVVLAGIFPRVFLTWRILTGQSDSAVSIVNIGNCAVFAMKNIGNVIQRQLFAENIVKPSL